MFGRTKHQLKTQADQQLLEDIEEARLQIRLKRDLMTQMTDTDEQLKMSLLIQQGIFNFLYHQARVRQVSPKQVAAITAQRMNRDY
ncbi:DUF2508 family protein [Lacticaseibacillus saniviri]|uniref:DUF2508 family protein n=1 Tax=Lacticaseibacillus saniviri JCM 17471 = DSM 24301 TaxID=1293598 RepID=A0A0R2N1X4_9LACO|nr:DUF2508 family protein [Lacticaseibacillus saniviri]KRO18013.1 hypothetical protein IV56_GL001809 [Lacticaseibacillus saniviri JCM 17471 = DSM 24301]MCG4283088.1 YaaL family protein [Lacticaseibacillus saniviri]